MADNKELAQTGKQQRADDGKGAADAGVDRPGGFVHSAPEANVFPAGARQGERNPDVNGDSAAGTPDEGKLGGSGGTSAAGTTGNDPDR